MIFIWLRELNIMTSKIESPPTNSLFNCMYFVITGSKKNKFKPLSLNFLLSYSSFPPIVLIYVSAFNSLQIAKIFILTFQKIIFV